MTMNNAEFSIKNLKFAKSLAGMKVYIAEEPQPTRRDKEEMTPEREKAELEEIMNCGMISAGLPTDLARANSI